MVFNGHTFNNTIETRETHAEKRRMKRSNALACKEHDLAHALYKAGLHCNDEAQNKAETRIFSYLAPC